MSAPAVLPSWNARVADALVLWPERAQKAQTNIKPDKLLERLARANESVPLEDLASAIQAFDLKKRPSFLDWIDCLVEDLDLRPQLRLGQGARCARVVVNARKWRSWLAASARYDLDCLLTYSLAEQGADDSEWGVACDLWSHDLEAMLMRGVGDMHIHLNGHRQANALWLRTVMSGLEPNELDDFHKRLTGDPVKEALVHQFTGETVSQQSFGSALRERLNAIASSAPQDFVNAERRALIEIWRAATRDPRIATEIDQYFNAKCAFLALLTQSPFGVRSGLQEFREFFSAARVRAPRERAPARVRRDLADVFCAARDEGILRRLELRIAPLPAKSAYENLLTCHDAALAELDPQCDHLNARFCVHFMRSMNHFRPHRDGGGWRQSWFQFHQDLSRLAAVFHDYRLALGKLGDGGREKLQLIPRIDVAGQERDNPPEHFAFIFRLLRGSAPAWSELNKAHEEIYEPWRALVRQDGAMTPMLHASCHAGEDYFHPIDGLAAIDAAIEGLELADGDSIGHGLALGAVGSDGSILKGERCFAPVGRQFDVLLWLHWLTAGENLPTREMKLIDDGLAELGGKIGVERPAAGWAELHSFLKALRGPVLANSDAKDRGAALFYRLHAEDSIANARMKPLEIESVFDQLPRAAVRARNAVAAKLAARGVIVEINPSSNLRIWGGMANSVNSKSGMKAWPLMNLLRDWQADLRFTINTDDPGVFATSITSEFALLLQCLIEDGWRRNDAIQFLDRCRVAGLEALR